MKKYLLDTNICIYFIKGQFELNKKIAEVGEQNCFISEMTIAKLKFGVENSSITLNDKGIAGGEYYIKSRLSLLQYFCGQSELVENII